MKGELLKAQAFLTDKERGSLMGNYRQLNRKQIYQISTLMSKLFPNRKYSINNFIFYLIGSDWPCS